MTEMRDGFSASVDADEQLGSTDERYPQHLPLDELRTRAERRSA